MGGSSGEDAGQKQQTLIFIFIIYLPQWLVDQNVHFPPCLSCAMTLSTTSLVVYRTCHIRLGPVSQCSQLPECSRDEVE